MDTKIIASNIRRLREKRWTQEEFAYVAGIGYRTVQRAENGGKVSLDSLRAMAAVFNTTPDKLAKSRPKPQPSPERFSWDCPELDAIWRDRNTRGYKSRWNTHVLSCPICRQCYRRPVLDLDNFPWSPGPKEVIEEQAAYLVDGKKAVRGEITEIADVLTNEQILAINARVQEAVRTEPDSNSNEWQDWWDAMNRDLITIIDPSIVQFLKAQK